MDNADLNSLMTELGKSARAAARRLAQAPAEAKNKALRAAAAAIRADAAAIKAANAIDMEGGRAKNLTPALLDRLLLDDKRIEGMAKGLEDIAALPDPVGDEIARWQRPNGLDIARIRVPLGVIGIIYESRPNVTADQMLPTTDRAAVGIMLRMSDFIDVIVPRGGKSLIERVIAESRIPLFQHLDGICHTYVDGAADLEMARKVVVNAKMRRTGICGATETLLVDRKVASTHLAPLVKDLLEAGCEVRGDEAAQAVDARVLPASDEDWRTEYLDAIISVKLVDGVEDAIAHIEANGSHHTESIITADEATAATFFAGVDSAILLHNASTQFADGGEFGMGAEIGISTGKMHARGPVGVEQLTTFKYVVRGTGQTRS